MLKKKELFQNAFYSLLKIKYAYFLLNRKIIFYSKLLYDIKCKKKYFFE
jgi:hypothetical protein